MQRNTATFKIYNLISIMTLSIFFYIINVCYYLKAVMFPLSYIILL